MAIDIGRIAYQAYANHKHGDCLAFVSKDQSFIAYHLFPLDTDFMRLKVNFASPKKDRKPTKSWRKGCA